MTTVAFDGYDLAADGRVTNGDKIVTDAYSKIFKINLPDGHIYFAAAGNLNDIEVMKNWIAGGMKPEDKPVPKKQKKDTSFEAFIIGPNGAIDMDGELIPIDVAGPAAIGSGWVPALAAMYAGKTATEAVAVAKKIDVFSGGKIKTVHIKPRKPKR